MMIYSDIQFIAKVPGKSRSRVALLLFLGLLHGSVFAGYEEGATAFEKGDFASALNEFRPLAEAGDAKAVG